MWLFVNCQLFYNEMVNVCFLLHIVSKQNQEEIYESKREIWNVLGNFADLRINNKQTTGKNRIWFQCFCLLLDIYFVLLFYASGFV